VRRLTFCALVAMGAVGFTSAGQDTTLTSMKDVARRLGGTATNKIDIESPSMSMKDLTQTADLILRGRLESMTTRLSDDESAVYRDFTVSPIEIVKQPSDLSQAKRPGLLQMLTVRQIGGTLVVDGLKLITSTNFEDRQTPMAAGNEYVLFLSRATPSTSTTMSTGTHVFQLTSPHWGIYPIRNGKVGNFSKWLAQRTDRKTDDPAAFVAEIRDLVQASKQSR
jgi:hypothetical protein